MSIFSSEQAIKPNYIDLMFLSFALILALLVLVPSYTPIRTAPQSIDNIHISAPVQSISERISFVADQHYWNANCNQGWLSDARCDTIVARSQSCAISVESAYCSQYKSYLQRYSRK